MSTNPDDNYKLYRLISDFVKNNAEPFDFGHEPQPKKTPKLKPDFSHRLSSLGGEATPWQLQDAINNLALQADSSLVLISDQFVFEGEEEKARLSGEVMYWSIESVRQTVKDMRAIVDAYHKATIQQRNN